MRISYPKKLQELQFLCTNDHAMARFIVYAPENYSPHRKEKCPHCEGVLTLVTSVTIRVTRQEWALRLKQAGFLSEQGKGQHRQIA